MNENIIPAASEILVSDGEKIQAGHSLSDGPKNPQDILRIEGQVAAQRYIVDEVQSVYSLKVFSPRQTYRGDCKTNDEEG